MVNTTLSDSPLVVLRGILAIFLVVGALGIPQSFLAKCAATLVALVLAIVLVAL